MNQNYVDTVRLLLAIAQLRERFLRAAASRTWKCGVYSYPGRDGADRKVSAGIAIAFKRKKTSLAKPSSGGSGDGNARDGAGHEWRFLYSQT